jgi:3-deoxy-D-manno-octulosonate 8-phosphate phosphatase (KDO 8-P phosphatase)
MLQVGLPMAVADAVSEVKDASFVISGKPGGHGAIRELLEFILKAQGKWEQIVASFHDINEQSDNIAAPTEALQQ